MVTLLPNPPKGSVLNCHDPKQRKNACFDPWNVTPVENLLHPLELINNIPTMQFRTKIPRNTPLNSDNAIIYQVSICPGIPKYCIVGYFLTYHIEHWTDLCVPRPPHHQTSHHHSPPHHWLRIHRVLRLTSPPLLLYVLQIVRRIL